jgi:predicted  nucleic acid-binding Zn-ribbon protein
LKDEILRLAQEIKDQKALLESTRQIVIDKENTKVKLDYDMRVLNSEIENLKSQLQDFKEAFSGLTGENKSLRGRTESVEKEIASKENQIVI